MKTPREVLLQHHQATDAKLNQVRRDVVAGFAEPVTLRWRVLPSRMVLYFWRELIWPVRRIWTGFALVWLVILITNFSIRDTSQSLVAKSSRPSPEKVAAFLAREGLLAELIKPREAQIVEPPKPTLPPPRSQRRSETVAT